MFTLRVINGYRVFGQDYLTGDTVVIPEADKAEQLLAFRFQYGADHLAVFELVEETVSGSAVLETGSTDTEVMLSQPDLASSAEKPLKEKRKRNRARKSVSTESPAKEASASLAFTDVKSTDADASDA